MQTSINWSAIFGLILLFWVPFTAIAGVEVYSRGGKAKGVLLLALGRYIFGILCAGILFFQGWRLDPILQFGQTLLVIGLIVETFYGISRDGFSPYCERERFSGAYEMARVNQIHVPKKSITLWYLLTLSSVLIPFAGGIAILALALRRFSYVEKRLAELNRNV